MESWQINLSLIPSIALILMSANNLALGLTNEINSHFTLKNKSSDDILPQKIQQLKRLSLSIFLMYLSLSILIFNALLVALSFIPESYDKAFMLLSIAILFIAIYLKVQFSFKAYLIRTLQFNSLIKNQNANSD